MIDHGVRASLAEPGALVLTGLAAMLQRRAGPAVAVRWTVAALAIYAIVLAVTFAINIPLNNELDQAGDPDPIAVLAHVRNQFEGPWAAANIVRAVLYTAAVAALARALFLHGRSTTDRQARANAGGRWLPPATFPAASSPPTDPSPRLRSIR